MWYTCSPNKFLGFFASKWDILQEIQVRKALFKSSSWGATVFVLMYLLFLQVNGWHSVFVGLPAKLWSGNWVCFKVKCFTQCFNCTRANSINIHSSIKLFSTISTYAETICIAFSKFASLVFKNLFFSETPSSLSHTFKLQGRCTFLKVISLLFLSKNGPVPLCSLYPCVENVAFIITPSFMHLPDDLTELMLWRICWLALFPCLMC